MEESYGDAKNLRSRHPRAALGFVFSLRADAFSDAPRVAAWILDLLAKLGREDDAYDAVALVIPRYPEVSQSEAADQSKEQDQGALQAVELEPPPSEEPLPTTGEALDHLFQRLLASPPVDLVLDAVPDELSADRFLEHMVRHVLDNSPITRHEDARTKLDFVNAQARGRVDHP